MRAWPVLLLLWGCTETNDPYTLVVDFDPSTLADTAQIVEVAVVESCGDQGVEEGALAVGASKTLVLEKDDDSLPSLGKLEKGEVGLYARARDASCKLVAAGCSATTVKSGGGKLTVALHSIDGIACAETQKCQNGVCGPGTLPDGEIAYDEFERESAEGWGVSDSGFEWEHKSGEPPFFSVEGEDGVMDMSVLGQGRSAWLKGIAEEDVDIRVTVSSDAAGTGSFGSSLSVMARRVAKNVEYHGVLRFASDGQMHAAIKKAVGSSTDDWAGGSANEVAIPGTWATGKVFALHMTTKGTNPTTVTFSAWAQEDGVEPETPDVSIEDSSEELQLAGTIGVLGYVGNGSVATKFRVDHLSVKEPE